MLASITLLSLIYINLQLVYGEVFPENCGRQHRLFPDLRIVGGQKARPGEFPWQVWISCYDQDGNHQSCGATIINSQWILTAAHCICNSDVYSYSVYLGVTNTSDINRRISSVQKIFQHEGYNPTSNHNDLALIKIYVNIDFDGSNGLLEPICLPNNTMHLTDCVATGFGSVTNKYGKGSEILNKISEQVVDDSACSFFSYYNRNINICGGHDTDGKGVCSGDSGGPLQCKASDDRYYQLGIASYVIFTCAWKGIPDVFVKVSNYLSWIEDIISNN